ncbi:MAG: hypothetical protein WCL30_06530 [Pseudomonadota bacterium]
MKKTLLLIITLGLLASCSFPHSDLKSPCVGASGSPCDRRPVNNWWLHQEG